MRYNDIQDTSKKTISKSQRELATNKSFAKFAERLSQLTREDNKEFNRFGATLTK